MDELKNILLGGLEPKTKMNIQRRYEALMRGGLFEEQRESEDFANALSKGWSKSRIEILCYLNSFYQIVLGPIRMS